MPHVMEVVREEQGKRGWYLAWRCPEKGCDASGNTTTPSLETARKLFAIVQDGHESSEREG